MNNVLLRVGAVTGILFVNMLLHATCSVAHERSPINSSNRYSLGLQTGLVGFGPELGYHIKRGMNFKVLAGSSAISQQLASGSVSGHVTSNFSGVALLTTFHPHDQPFGLAVGYVFRNAATNLVRSPGPNGVSINGNIYTAAQLNSIDAGFTMHNGAVFGLDYSTWSPHPGLQFNSSLGYILGGVCCPTVQAYVPAGSPLINNSQFATDLGTARAKIQSAANGLSQLYFTVGISQNF